MKHELKQQFQKSDRLNNKIEEKLPLKCQILNDTERSEFARDRDRILFSRPFRRLQHKAQVFSNEKGDHYRTRLTHTLEVCQISRSLARYLDANEDLAEAIALGHDIGHAPFGHQGERVLDEVMSGEDNLGLIKYPLNLGGFNHNYNSIRILDVVQSKYENYEGLNLSWQVLEGILKHTKTKSKWDIKRFVNNESLIGKLHLDSKFSVTLEGQIVEVADEIAQRQHDIDDGLRNKELDIQEKVLYEKIINEVDQIISTKYQYNNFDREYLDKLCDLIIRLKESLLKSKKSESKLIRQDNLVRNMIEYFILDVFANSRRNILKMSKLNKYNERNLLETKVVDLSPFGKELNEKIEKLVNYKILNSYDVNKNDGKTRVGVRQLFKAYYTNPLQMPSYALKRLENKLRSNSKLYCMSLQNDDNAINFNDVNYTQLSRSDVIALNNSLKMEDLTKLNLTPAIFKMNQENLRNDVFYEHLKAINNTENNEITTIKDKCLKCLVENHYAYLSTICDYISGMSDNYANNQYKNLYLVE